MKWPLIQIFLIVSMPIVIISGLANAEVPLLINYRGYVDVSDPVIGLPTGALTVDLEFNLFDSSEIESALPLWTEKQTVQLLDGNFAVLLGSVTPLSLDLFSGGLRYITVDLEEVTIIGPQQILSVPYAMQAGNIYSAPSGYVGIGTTNPTSRLDVMGNVEVAGTLDAGGNINTSGTLSSDSITAHGLIESTAGGYKFPDGTTQSTKAYGDGHSLDAADGSPTDSLYIDNEGKIGVSTTSPQANLHLQNPGPVSLLLEADTDNDLIGDATDHPNIQFSQDGGIVTANVGFLNGEDNVFGVMNDYQAVHADLVFGTSNTEQMRITADGKIGMGTSSPSADLEICGDIKLGTRGQYYAAGGIENLRIVRGNVNADGTKAQGEGFTVFRHSTARYAILFTPPFSDYPSVTVTTGSPGGDDDNVANISYLTPGQVNIYICDVTDGYDNAEDSWFSFIAIGPR